MGFPRHVKQNLYIETEPKHAKKLFQEKMLYFNYFSWANAEGIQYLAK